MTLSHKGHISQLLAGHSLGEPETESTMFFFCSGGTSIQYAVWRHGMTTVQIGFDRQPRLNLLHAGPHNAPPVVVPLCPHVW